MHARDPAHTLDIGSRRELFVDRHLVDSLSGADFKMHLPQPVPPAVSPVRGAYMTVLHEGERYRAYYRDYVPGYAGQRHDGNEGEITCYAESRDGREWSFPDLGLLSVDDLRPNNAVLAHQPPYCHNFAPLLDERPDVAPQSRYKALAGTHRKGARAGGGLHAFESPDGLRWRLMRNEPVIDVPEFAFDSQNVLFWSHEEGCYVCYFRTWQTSHGRLRTISRTTSPDYVHWSEPIAMDPNLPGEHLYTSQTHPYFRAPHIYLALPTRFQPDRGASTDILFMATRAGSQRYDRLFTEAFIRPGLDADRWGNRANYAAAGVVPTGAAEMSIYHAKSGQRYVLRTDGFISIHAATEPGELRTVPLTFTGNELLVNYSTSAAGRMAVELQQPDGAPIAGFTLDEAVPTIGDAIEQAVAWRGGPDVSSLSGRPIRLRVVLQEADLFSFRFR